MWGLGKFLVGGLLGAIFGFLVSPKQAQRVRDALLSQSAAVGPVTSRALHSPDAAVLEVEPELEPEVVGVSDIADLTFHYGDDEPLPGVVVEDEPTAAEVDVELDEPALESEEPEASIDSDAWAPASSHDAWSTPVAPETQTQEQPHLTTGWVLEPPEFEPDLDVPEFEPVATELEKEPAPPEPEPTAAEPEPAPPEPEPTEPNRPCRRARTDRAVPERVATELEPEPAPAGWEPEPAATEPRPELEAELTEAESTLLESEPADAEAPVELVEETGTEPLVAELGQEPAAAEPGPAAAEEEPELMEAEAEPTASEEQPASAEMLAEPEEPVSAIETVVEVQAEPSPVVLSDLRARIEETRRRIQRELDQPFAPDTEVPAEEQAPTFAEYPVDEAEAEISTPVEYVGYAESTIDEAEEVGEAAVEIEAPAAAEEPYTTVLPEEEEAAPVLRDDQGVETEPGDDVEIQSAVGEDVPSMIAVDEESQFDHEAMRRRIEETRNRLKAKAFDAMMKGESALLARDFDSPASTMSPEVDGAVLDSEVAETIDTTLIEEDL